MTSTSHLSDEDFVGVVEQAHADGANDDSGGVHSTTVAERLDVSHTHARRRLNRLVQEGELVRVWGINPETSLPRAGYLTPTDAEALKHSSNPDSADSRNL